MDVAILCCRVTISTSRLSATTEWVVDLSAKPAIGDCHTLAGDQFPVEPGRAVAADLFLEIEGGQGPNSEPIAALTEVIRLSALNDVLGDLSMIGIDPFHMTSPAQASRRRTWERMKASGSLPWRSKLSWMRSRCRLGR